MSTFFSSIKEFTSALKNTYTYNFFKNSYCLFGLLLGLFIAFLALALHQYAINAPLMRENYTQILQTHKLYWVFLMHPVIFAIIFGALGTIKKNRETKINDLIERLKVESTHDSLTNLYNRAFFEFILAQEITRAERQNGFFSLVIFDIDHFKEVNDHYGHLVGDQVLISIGFILKTNSRSYDTAARWGGEEFSLILPNTTQEDALRIAERIRQEFSQMRHILNKHEFRCTLSAGIATYAALDTATELTKKADKALYEAKALGRNCLVIFNETLIK